MTKCLGCGDNSENDLCDRCFRLKHYNEYQLGEIKSPEYIKIIENINIEDHVALVIDVLNIPTDLSLFERFKKVTLVISKRDQLSFDIKDEKILSYFNNFKNKIIISSVKNYNLDELYEIINKYPITYFIGYVNSGKSTLINKLIYNYSEIDYEITTSMMPSTTKGVLKIKLNDQVTLIDTPGIFDGNEILEELNPNDLKKLVITKKIKPVVYQIKEDQTLVFFDNFFFSIKKPNDIIFYFSNQIDLRRIYKSLDLKNEIMIKNTCDLVIPGIGFINIKKPGIIKYQIPKKANIYIRPPLI